MVSLFISSCFKEKPFTLVCSGFEAMFDKKENELLAGADALENPVKPLKALFFSVSSPACKKFYKNHMVSQK